MEDVNKAGEEVDVNDSYFLAARYAKNSLIQRQSQKCVWTGVAEYKIQNRLNKLIVSSSSSSWIYKTLRKIFILSFTLQNIKIRDSFNHFGVVFLFEEENLNAEVTTIY